MGTLVGPVPLAPAAPMGASSLSSVGKRPADAGGAVVPGPLSARAEKMRKLSKNFKEELDEGVRRRGAVEAWVSIALDGFEDSVVGRQLVKLGDREEQVTEMSFMLEEKATNTLVVRAGSVGLFRKWLRSLKPEQALLPVHEEDAYQTVLGWRIL